MIFRFLFLALMASLSTSPSVKRKVAPSHSPDRSRGGGSSAAPTEHGGDALDKSASGGASPTLFGIMASKRLAKQFVTRFSSKKLITPNLKMPTSDTASTRVQMVMPIEPSYRMEPRVKFNAKVVEGVIQEVLEQRLVGFKYSHKQSPLVSRILSEEIKDRVKRMRYDRYKIVCIVTIGQTKGQGLRVASRCAWDTSLDNLCSYTWRGGSTFCTATVYGLYHE